MSKGIVLALGAGSARGLAQIGVIEVLVREKIPIRAVVGTSIGAEIGGFLAAGISIDTMIRLGTKLDWLQTMRLFAPDFSGAGITTGKGIQTYLQPYLGDKKIEKLDVGYAAIATDLVSGNEVVIRQGNLLDAVRASISLPGILSPVRLENRILVDGGLVNPVPFDTARDIFSGPVLAVATHPRALPSDYDDQRQTPEWEQRLDELLRHPWTKKLPYVQQWLRGFRQNKGDFTQFSNLGISDVFNKSLHISAHAIVCLRERLNPPDLMIAPEVRQIGMLEFYRGREAIAAGRKAAELALPKIRSLLI